MFNLALNAFCWAGVSSMFSSTVNCVTADDVGNDGLVLTTDN